MAKYGHRWHLKTQLQLAAAANIIPNYHISDDDPEDIKELKKLLHLHRHELYNTVQMLAKSISEEYEKEHNNL